MREDLANNSKDTGIEKSSIIEFSSNTLHSNELKDLLSITNSQLRLPKENEIELVLQTDEYTDDIRHFQDIAIALIPVICIKLSESIIKDFVNFLYVSAKNKLINRKAKPELKIISKDGTLFIINQKTNQKEIDAYLAKHKIVRIVLNKKEEQ